jgi:hypothetical protein
LESIAFNCCGGGLPDGELSFTVVMRITTSIPVTTMSIQSFPFKSARSVFGIVLDKLQAVLQTRPMSVLYLTSAIVCLFAGRPFLTMAFMAMVVYSNPLLIWQLQGRYRQVLSRYRLNAVLLTGIIFGLLAGSILCLAVVDPSHAQFFQKAEAFLTTVTQGANAAAAGPNNTAVLIKLVMNTLRVLFVMYMLFGVVQVFQAVRQGEEWKDLARTPFFVLLAGTMGDVLIGAITGT